MAFEGINFPVYRKYKNGKSYFKIISREEFEEIQIVGTKKIIHLVAAKQLPEMNQIYDLVYDRNLTETITDSEYLNLNMKSES